MPNHVRNELHASAAILDAMKEGERDVDFNKVVPMAESLSVEASMHVLDWAEIALGIVNLRTLREPTPDPLAAFQAGNYGDASKRIHQFNLIRAMTEGPFPKDFDTKDFDHWLTCIKNLREYGHASWYTWSNENWGTKWNAYVTERLGPTVVRFDTAWSMPSKWFLALSLAYPEETIRIRWADKDWGCNAGDLTMHGGEIVSGGRFENMSAEAKEVAADLHGPEPSDADEDEDDA